MNNIKTIQIVSVLLFLGILVGACGSNTTKVEDTNAEEQLQEEVYRLEGKINAKYGVHMILDLKSLTGGYYYDKSGVDNYLTLKIHSYNPASGQMTVDEFNNKGEMTGEFSGTLTDEGFSGHAKFGEKTMPFNLGICRDASAKFPPIAGVSETLLASTEPSASETVTEKDTPYDQTQGKTMIITVHQEDSTATDLYIRHYTIRVSPNGMYHFNHENTYGWRYTRFEEFEKQKPTNEEYSGSWEIYGAIKVGGEYKDFLCLKRANRSDIWLSPDKTLIWWGEDSYHDADAYNIANAVKVTSIRYE
ncbi:hypothetical protein [uncultured Duncaniella sp.]|uniref:hypothetical protein n=1 Tax=uncultured Duncaniella sp. TaxID=2768039 RepID=UPI002616BEDD|nr:hypothetical protein [uncultured Duncaniella sp.]